MTRTDIANLALSKIGETLIVNLDAPTDKAGRLAALHYPQCLKELLRAHFWDFAMSCVSLPAADLREYLIVSGALTAFGDPVVFPKLFEVANAGFARPYYQADPVLGAGDGAGLSSMLWGEFSQMWVLEYLPAAVDWRSADVATPELGYYSATGGAGGVPAVRRIIPAEAIAGRAYAHTLPADFIKLEEVVTMDGGRVDRFDVRRVGDVKCLLSTVATPSLRYVALVDEPDAWDPLFTAAMVTLLASRLARGITGSEAMEAELRQTYEMVDLPAARLADSQDTASNENRPMAEFLAGSLTRRRNDFLVDLDGDTAGPVIITPSA